ncbi:MAG TPA: hypothetical protein DIU37_04025, partial [Opitutae bacterium]|nr:hypothetical protein [Opitutae bacterium]
MRCCWWCFIAIFYLVGCGFLAAGGGPGFVDFDVVFAREFFVLNGDGGFAGFNDSVEHNNGSNFTLNFELDDEVRTQLLYFINLVEANLQGHGEYQAVDFLEYPIQGNHYAQQPLVAWLCSHGLIPDQHYSIFTTIDNLICLLVYYWGGGRQAMAIFDQRLVETGISLFDRVYQYLLAHGVMPVLARDYARSAMEGVRQFGVPFMDALQDALIAFMGDRYRLMGVPNDSIEVAVVHFREQHFTAGVDVYRAFLIGFYEAVGVPFELLHRVIDLYLNEEGRLLNNGEGLDQAFMLRWAAFRAYGLSDKQAKKAARHQLNLEALGLLFARAHWVAFTRHCRLIFEMENAYSFIPEFDALMDSGEDALYAWAYIFYWRVLGIAEDHAAMLAAHVYNWVSPLGLGHCLSFIDAVLAVLYSDLGLPDYAVLKAVKRQREILAKRTNSFREACWQALFEALGANPHIALLEAQRQERLTSKKKNAWSFDRAHLLCLARCFDKKIDFNSVDELVDKWMETRSEASLYKVYL